MHASTALLKRLMLASLPRKHAWQVRWVAEYHAVAMCDGSFACEQTSFTRRSHARCFFCILHCRMRMVVTNAWHSDMHTTHSPSCGTAEHCMHPPLHGLSHNVAINIMACVQVTRFRHPCGACSNRPRSPIFQVWGCPRRHPDQGACHSRRAR
jgi:hypothetical protein